MLTQHRRRARATLVATLVLGLSGFGLAGLGQTATAAGAEDPAVVQSYAPEGTRNVALDASASASDESRTDHPVSNLINGKSGKGAINLWVAESGNVESWVELALPQVEEVQRVVMFPRGDPSFYGVYYPARFTVSLLDQAGEKVWEKYIEHPNSAVFNSAIIDSPDVIDVPSVQAKTIRIDILERHEREGFQLQLSQIAVFATGDPGEPPPPPPSLESFRPEGTENLALRSEFTASSSYEKADESWAVGFLNDGQIYDDRGWSTNPYDRVQDPATEAWVVGNLLCPAEISRVVVFPRTNNFPKSYRVEVYSDGESWHQVGASSGNARDADEPQVFDLDQGTEALEVRVFVQERNGPDGPDGYLVQLSEIAIFGVGAPCFQQVKDSLLMPPGATESSWLRVLGTSTLDPTFEVVSSDTSVATVAPDGTITAVGVGKTVVTAKVEGETWTVPVEVSNDIPGIGEDYLITVFWAPPKDYVNQEQYGYLAEAGIDLVQNTHTGDLVERETNIKMAGLAHANGMLISAADTLSGGVLASASQDEVDTWIDRYVHVPGVGSLYIIDEPADATQFAAAFNRVREVAPSLYPHMNFNPYWAYGSETGAMNAMRAWLDSTGGVRDSIYEPDYLMYDLYPFTINGTSYEGMLTNLNLARKVGLEYNIKTGMYLQSVGIPGAYRLTTEPEIRYEANLAMAYGYKQLSYFTWWTPTERSEPFTNAIIDPQGKKTELFEPVKTLNAEIHALGPTLMKLDAKEVYLNGETYGQEAVPEDFLAQPTSTDNLVLSHLVDRDSGADYLFVVNNSFEKEADASLLFDEGVVAVSEVSRADGSLGQYIPLGNEVLQRTLPPGEGVLYALAGDVPATPVPEVDRFVFDPATVKVESGKNGATSLVVEHSQTDNETGPFNWAIHQQGAQNSEPVLAGTSAEDCNVTAKGFTCEVSVPVGTYYAVLSYGAHEYELKPKLVVAVESEEPGGEGSEGEGSEGGGSAGENPDEKEGARVPPGEKPKPEQREQLPVTGSAIVVGLLVALALGLAGGGLYTMRRYR